MMFDRAPFIFDGNLNGRISNAFAHKPAGRPEKETPKIASASLYHRCIYPTSRFV
jgi:hypothetical protein